MTRRQRRTNSALWGFVVLLSILFAFLVTARSCRATTITGKVKWQGQPFTGYLDVALVYPSVSMSGDYLTLPGANPNGSISNIAGILNENRNVLGMMPHPDRSSEELLGSADGWKIFASMVEVLAAH